MPFLNPLLSWPDYNGCKSIALAFSVFPPYIRVFPGLFHSLEACPINRGFVTIIMIILTRSCRVYLVDLSWPHLIQTSTFCGYLIFNVKSFWKIPVSPRILEILEFVRWICRPREDLENLVWIVDLFCRSEDYVRRRRRYWCGKIMFRYLFLSDVSLPVFIRMSFLKNV